MANKLDHIVVAADSLERGTEYIRDELGVDIPKGGFHQTMGTFNHLMQLGNESYLELIAIDPQAEPPNYPRWFGLDEALMRGSLHTSPRLITWVMNTTDMQGVVRTAKFDTGRPTELSRDQLRWQIALSDDGRLLGNGLLPYVIQWHSRPHPSRGMADLGCRLLSLKLYHNRVDWLESNLNSIDARHLVEVKPIADSESPYLSVVIETPGGVKSLSSRV
ncbi:MAG: VOC family protein [Gammaproteobacteria bacterium]|nr:VOC family protein [Gammaproteobacteria bacterium]